MAHDMYPEDHPALSPELMVRAYAAGVFPMSEGADDPRVFWVDPKRRGVFPLDDFHLSRSLKRRIRKGGYRVEVNSDFASVVDGCADREPTWINAELSGCYMALHATGLAHSVEIHDDQGLPEASLALPLGPLFRRKHVLAPDGCIETCPRASGAPASVWGLYPIRYTVCDRPFAQPWRRRNLARRIPRKLGRRVGKDRGFFGSVEDCAATAVTGPVSGRAA